MPIAAPAAGRGGGETAAPAPAVCASVRCPAGKPLARPWRGRASRLFPGLLSAWPVRTPRSAGRGARAPPVRLRGTTRRARIQPRALSPRPAARRVPGAAPPPGAPLQPSPARASPRRPSPGRWPAAASGAGPAAREPQARLPNRPVTKLEGFHASIHFFISGREGGCNQLAFLFLYSLGFPNSLC